MRLTTTKIRSFELRRIALETEFFQITESATRNNVTEPAQRRRSVSVVEKRLRELQSRIVEAHPEAAAEDDHKGIGATAGLIATTIGNVLFWASNVNELLMPNPDLKAAVRGPEQPEALAAALDSYNHATGIWATFGALEAQRALDVLARGRPLDGTKVSEQYRKKLDDLVHGLSEELSVRMEQRTQALVHQTALLARYWRGDAEEDDIDQAYFHVQGVLNHIHDPMTIYSQFSKANVPRADFERETASFHRQAHDDVAGAAEEPSTDGAS
jgi:hypothetical protein